MRKAARGAEPPGPVCDQDSLTVVTELSSSLFVRCGNCGFIWIEGNPACLTGPRPRRRLTPSRRRCGLTRATTSARRGTANPSRSAER